jgi:hypothetical protein
MDDANCEGEDKLQKFGGNCNERKNAALNG